jgi:hypothetical protein
MRSRPLPRIHESFSEPGRPGQWVNFEWKPSRLGDTIRVIHPIKSDWGLGPAKVLQDSRAYNAIYTARKFELHRDTWGAGPL